MINEVQGDMLEVTKGILVHGCNTQGVMGSGIAAAIRAKWPTEVYEPYRAHCAQFPERHSRQLLGTILPIEIAPDLVVVNAFTQHTFGKGQRHVSYDAVALCFEEIVKKYSNIWGPLCFPLIGAGLGGGNWRVIESIIDTTVPDDYNKTLFLLPGTAKP